MPPFDLEAFACVRVLMRHVLRTVDNLVNEERVSLSTLCVLCTLDASTIAKHEASSLSRCRLLQRAQFYVIRRARGQSRGQSWSLKVEIQVMDSMIPASRCENDDVHACVARRVQAADSSTTQ